jgi:hypothetical protein
VYLSRAYYLPIDEFEEQHSYHDLERVQHELFRLYEKAFGEHQVVYNVHMFCIHAHEIHQRHGIFPACSAFPSEVSICRDSNKL